MQCSSEFPFFPGVQSILRLIEDECFGRILDVQCGFEHCSDLDPTKQINWKRTLEQNGEYGCMGDLGMHVWHVPFAHRWRPANVRAILSNVYEQRPDGDGQYVPCPTWDNAELLCEVEQRGYTFPLTAHDANCSW